MSPSAKVHGHSPERRVTVGRKRSVKINDLRPIGNYAVSSCHGQAIESRS